MNPFCLTCRVSVSIKSQEDLSKKYQILDCQSLLKKRMPVKPDGNCLPLAILTAEIIR